MHGYPHTSHLWLRLSSQRLVVCEGCRTSKCFRGKTCSLIFFVVFFLLSLLLIIIILHRPSIGAADGRHDTWRRGRELHSVCHSAKGTRGGMSSSSERGETSATVKLTKLRISPRENDIIYNHRMLNVKMYIGLVQCSLS